MSRPEDGKLFDDGGFLGRWAKRKQAVQRETHAPDQPLAAPSNNLPEQTDESLPLPSLDDILPGGDVSAFFQKHVPEALRAAALRKVWMTDPDIKDFIEMADYQLDYANPDSIPGWSSSIEGIDLKSMVDKIFNNVPKTEAEMPGNAPELLLTEKEADHSSEEPLHTHSTLVETADQSLASHEHPEPIQNGAVQNIPSESVVYETARKRHGGALPS